MPGVFSFAKIICQMENKTLNVYGIGNALVDIVASVSDEFLIDKKIEKGLMTLVNEEQQHSILKALTFDQSQMKCGGSAANTIIAVSQFGGKSAYSYKVANDSEGKFYVKDLTENGVESELHPNNIPYDGVTGRCLVMTTPDSERTMNTFLGITAEFSSEMISNDYIKQAEYIYVEGYLVSNEISQKAMIDSIRQAKTVGTKVALTFSDPSMVKYFGSAMAEVVNEKIDLLFCNEEEALLYANKDTLTEAISELKQVCEHLVITLGPKGALILRDGVQYDVNGIPTKAIDSNGAGDMFAGAYLYGITNGLNSTQAGELACKAASKVVSQTGPRLTKEEVLALN